MPGKYNRKMHFRISLGLLALLLLVLFPYGWLAAEWPIFDRLFGLWFGSEVAHVLGHASLFVLLGTAVLGWCPRLSRQPVLYLLLMAGAGLGQETLQLISFKHRPPMMNEIFDLAVDLLAAGLVLMRRYDMRPRLLAKSHFLLILALLFASTVSMTLLLARYFYTGEFLFRFLAWNLFLGWLPFLLATVVIMFPGKHYVTFGGSLLWLLFFPNAPYIVTDILHLWPRAGVPLWYDMILILSFAMTGLCLGFSSLGLMQGEVARRWGAAAGWGFVGLILLLSGFGIYIGRFLRWNSWDVFSNPLQLGQDLRMNLTTPWLLLKSAIITLALTAVFIFTYVVFMTLPHFVSVRDRSPSRSIHR